MLPVVELFYSLQGEGFFTGMPAVFIRLAGCSNACRWCDSKKSWQADKHPRMEVAEIVAKVLPFPVRMVVVTGGEPLQHSLRSLCRELKRYEFLPHLETSGAASFSGAWDWICLSPKRQCPPRPRFYSLADELKVVIETPDDFAWAEENAGRMLRECVLCLQPEWSRRKSIVPQIVDYIKQRPQWRLSLQTHKWLHID
ncbi:MAG: 7-carboxy-7-deazaguanine synthase QueE [Prevotellaceae bacterium]|jgi:organic radical activating enzyme|nr:7-carboxy-7-deazaguanine synthase QueE [Prevotellaceae bacterium]